MTSAVAARGGARRIAVITTSFPAHDDDPSGHFVKSAALALAREGAEVHVIAPGGDRRAAAVRIAADLAAPGALWLRGAGGGALFGWPGAIARARAVPWRLLHAVPFAAGVRGRLAEIGAVERTVAHWIVPSAFPLAIAAGVARGSLEVVAHGADVRALCAAPRSPRAWVVGALLAREAIWTFTSASSLSMLAGALPAALSARLLRASRVQPPQLDLPDVSGRARSLRALLRTTPQQPLFVSAGRLVRAKRFELAIDAVTAAAQGNPARLIVVGDGPDRHRLQRHAAATGAQVTFTGLLGRTETLAWIAAADVLLHPSAQESAPCVVREARALGVPVVACGAGDVASWSECDEGLSVVAPIASAIAEAMHRSRARRREGAALYAV